MGCSVCEKESVYKCPGCSAPYCSVNCCKQHKLVCTPAEKAELKEPETSSGLNLESEIQDAKFDSFLADLRVQELLKYDGLKTQLKLVANILTDPSLSGEMTSEGRSIVALKKIRELRKGGRDANLGIEELAETVVRLNAEYININQ